MERIEYYFRCDFKIRIIKINLIQKSPVLTKLITDNPDLGTADSPIMLDIDIMTLDCIIEVLRNGSVYPVPLNEIAIVSKYIMDVEDIVLVPQCEFIIVKVSEKSFCTTTRILSLSTYFNSYMEFGVLPKEIFIDKNAKSFRHILKHMRNTEYAIPSEYLYEIGFYDISNKTNEINISYLWDKYKKTEYCQSSFQNGLDAYLCGNPQITFHKNIYKRHTFFSRNNNQVFDPIIDSNIITFNISKGDILNNMFVHFVPINTELFRAKDIKIEGFELTAGGNRIDYNSWNFIQMNLDLFNPELKEKHLLCLEKNELYVPLFFNTNNPTLGFPMLALDAVVQLKVKLKNKSSSIYESRLVYKYNNLDLEETNKFKQNAHEYLYQIPSDLIENFDDYNAEIVLPFNGAIKWIIFKIDSEMCHSNNNLLVKAELYIDDKLYMQTDPLISFDDFINCCSELRDRDKTFLSNEDANFLDRVPRYNGRNKINNIFSDYYIMPFCFNILEHQPTGSLSIRNEKLKLCVQTSCKSGKIYVASMGYNVLRIMSRLHGFAYD